MEKFGSFTFGVSFQTGHPKLEIFYRLNKKAKIFKLVTLNMKKRKSVEVPH